ncbi:hypothetical protein ACU686_29415 [Yinghuangia aomiensis]
MDVTAFVALLDQLDSADGVLLDRLGPDVPERVRRMRGTPTRARPGPHRRLPVRRRRTSRCAPGA